MECYQIKLLLLSNPFILWNLLSVCLFVCFFIPGIDWNIIFVEMKSIRNFLHKATFFHLKEHWRIKEFRITFKFWMHWLEEEGKKTFGITWFVSHKSCDYDFHDQNHDFYEEIVQRALIAHQFGLRHGFGTGIIK